MPEAVAGWQTESLRFSFFKPITGDRRDLGIWRQMVGAEPEKQTSLAGNSVIIEEGDWGAHRLIVAALADRVDIHLQAKPLSPGLPSCGSLDEVFAFVLPAVPTDLFSACHRLAFGLILNNPSNSLAQAYNVTASYLPHIRFLEGGQDFQYQINLPSESTVQPTIKLNRLSKWSSVVVKVLKLDSTAGTTVPQEFFASRLELDINTHAENATPFQLDMARRLLDELIQEARRIFTEGVRA